MLNQPRKFYRYHLWLPVIQYTHEGKKFKKKKKKKERKKREDFPKCDMRGLKSTLRKDHKQRKNENQRKRKLTTAVASCRTGVIAHSSFS